MKTKINWINHIIEFIVVLLGVLIAFQMNQCSINKNRQKTINNHLEYIVEETKFNLTNLDTILKYSEINLKNVNKTIGLTYQDGQEQQINRTLMQLLNYGAVYIQKNAYTALVNSGDIRFIKSFDTKSDIINLYEFYNWLEAIDEMGINSYKENFTDFMKKNYNFSKRQMINNNAYKTYEFSNQLGFYKHFLSMRIEKIKDCKEEMNDYLKLYDK